MSCLLQVQGEDSSRPPNTVCLIKTTLSFPLPAGLALPVGPLLVSSYSRDPSDLAVTGTSVDCTVDAALPEGEKELTRFVNYLRERSKAAVVRLPGGHKLILSAESLISTGSPILRCHWSHRAALLPAPPRKQVDLGEVPASTMLADDFERDLNNRLSVFEDPAFSGPLILEPMEKKLRFIVHDVVSQWDGGATLASVSAGDDEDRHVEVYRSGYEPLEDEGIASAVINRVVGKSALKHQAGQQKAAPKRATDLSVLKKVNQVRDRRSIEEVQLERKRLKASSSIGGEGDAAS